MMTEPNKQIEELIGAIQAGVDLETACHYAGMTISSVYALLERGKIEEEKIEATGRSRKKEAEALRVWQGLRKARAEAIARNVGLIQKAAANGEWKAAAWWLERSHPTQYAPPDKRTTPPIDGGQSAPQIEG